MDTQTQSPLWQKHHYRVTGWTKGLFFTAEREREEAAATERQPDREKMRRECQSLISVFQHHPAHPQDPGLLQLLSRQWFRKQPLTERQTGANGQVWKDKGNSALLRMRASGELVEENERRMINMVGGNVMISNMALSEGDVIMGRQMNVRVHSCVCGGVCAWDRLFSPPTYTHHLLLNHIGLITWSLNQHNLQAKRLHRTCMEYSRLLKAICDLFNVFIVYCCLFWITVTKTLIAVVYIRNREERESKRMGFFFTSEDIVTVYMLYCISLYRSSSLILHISSLNKTKNPKNSLFYE